MKLSNLKYQLIILFVLLATVSCTKVIDLQLGNNTGELVIEGNLTNIPGTQNIKLSQNVPFTNTNVYPAVTGATVTINDQSGNNYRLTESQPGNYTIAGLAGIAGKTYTMTVLTSGTTYTASSTMPAPVALDSVTSKISPVNTKKRTITVHYQDQAGVVNQYRFVMFVNGIQVKSVFAYNDDFTDGRYVNNDLRENDIDIFPGDTVMVEMQCVDKPVYTYWSTLMKQQTNGPGGGVTPTNPPTNITPTTLGYFSAHTTQTQTIIVK